MVLHKVSCYANLVHKFLLSEEEYFLETLSENLWRIMSEGFVLEHDPFILFLTSFR